MKKVLFVCIHNSARSQIAEELLRKHGSDLFEVESAGFEVGELNPLAIDVLKEENIDIKDKSTNSVFEFFKQGRTYNYVVTVCDESNGQRCPLFPGLNYRIHWSFKDPNTFIGNAEVKINKTRELKEEIRTEVLKFIELVKENKIKENFPTNWKVG